MANTADLIALQADYPTAFADPEATPEDPTLPEPDEDGRTGETQQDGALLGDEPDEPTLAEQCYLAIAQMEHDPDLMLIAAHVLYQLGNIQSMKQHLANEPIRQAVQAAVDSGVIEFGEKPRKGGGTLRPLDEDVDEVSAPLFIELPETHARQGSAECPGGLCEL
jgi:hypothetical protein